ncbi:MULTISPECIES: NACHT domain-containing protein [Streptomyces]|uniref:NACHT domain-containing protein n=1 Tax=Streptomyces tricolor TaxID=68277 RepID=A0ABS9JJQ9_9ACTN|nr:NACHT domain-containing protein [Streptomyces tricolor]MCG0065808.1 NACHT domain-containing protein [Streptomyces tricolor]
MTWSTRRRSRRRLARDVLLLATALACAGLAGWMLVRGDEDAANQIATVGSLFVGFVSLLLALADFFRHEPAAPDPAALADDLAVVVEEQWRDEATARGLRDPRVLPLAWAATDRDVAHLPRTAHARVLRVRLGGRLDGRFEDVIARLADGYRNLPGRRLVAIGEPGSGKSVLAILLTLGLLAGRESGAPVPVLLPASSWDPVREPLDDWIVGTLALPYYSSRPEIPRTLLAHGLLLPVLDGLDEIPESARRSAIRGINAAIGAERPVVVTCRAAEYEDLIRGGAPALREAPVIEVSPVSADDVIAYLRDVDWPPGTDWSPVCARLRSAGGGPVADALSTPLMVTSARLVYQRLRRDPAELLDGSRFDCRFAVEQHLTDRLIDAAYAPGPGPTGSAGRDGPWTAAQARTWLTFLARYLHEHRERDLAWWRMSERLLSPWFPPAIGVLAGLVLGVGALAWIVLTGALGAEARGDFPVIGGFVGGGFALLSVIVWYGVPGNTPGRLSFTVQGSLGRLRRGFRAGVTLTAFAAAPVLLVLAGATALSTPDGPGSFDAVEDYCVMGGVAGCLAVVTGLALAAHDWLNAPPHHAAQVSPGGSIAQDRRSALAGAALAGCVVAATGLLGWYAGVLSGAWLARALNDWVGWPGTPDLALLAGSRWQTVVEPFGGNVFVLTGVTMALPGAVFGLLLLLTRAWPRYVLTRLFLAARGRLPLRLTGFLADARRRGLLRQSGGVHQFRHVRLQETLAGHPMYPTDEPPPAPSRTVRRRLVLTAGAATALTAAVGNGARDGSSQVFPASAPLDTVAFHPAGETRLAIGAEDGTVWVWDYARDPRPRGGRPLRRGEGHEPVYGLAFHPWHPILAVGHNSAVEIWHTRHRRTVRPRGRDGPGTFSSAIVAFSPGGELFAAGKDSELAVWDTAAADGCPASPLTREIGQFSGLVFDPATHEPVTLDSTGRVRRHSVTGKITRLFATAHPRQVDEGFAGLTVDATGDAYAFVREVREYTREIWGFPAGSRRPELWTRDRRTGAWAPARWPWPVSADTVALSPNGRLLALARTDDHETHVWARTPAGALVHLDTLTGHTGPVQGMAFSPAGDLLATACLDGTVRLWRTEPWLRRLS